MITVHFLCVIPNEKRPVHWPGVALSIFIVRYLTAR